eukprot:g24782.t1
MTVSRIVSMVRDIAKFKHQLHNPSIGKSEDYDSGQCVRGPTNEYYKAEILLFTELPRLVQRDENPAHQMTGMEHSDAQAETLYTPIDGMLRAVK